MKNEILSISGLATSYALKAFENKIPNVSSLDKKKQKKTKQTDCNTKITEIKKT